MKIRWEKAEGRRIWGAEGMPSKVSRGEYRAAPEEIWFSYTWFQAFVVFSCPRIIITSVPTESFKKPAATSSHWWRSTKATLVCLESLAPHNSSTSIKAELIPEVCNKNPGCQDIHKINILEAQDGKVITTHFGRKLKDIFLTSIKGIPDTSTMHKMYAFDDKRVDQIF